jgi:hypothetical protein
VAHFLGSTNARCRLWAAADMIAPGSYGPDNKLLTAIHGGGHNRLGLASVDEGLRLLDGSEGVRGDPVTRTARSPAVCVTGDPRQRAAAFGYGYEPSIGEESQIPPGRSPIRSLNATG